MNNRSLQSPRHVSRRFTTLEGWHEVGEGMFALGQKTLIFSFADQIDLERDNNHGDTPSVLSLKEKASEGGREGTPINDNSSEKNLAIIEAGFPVSHDRPYHVFTSGQKWRVVVLVGAAGLFSGLSSNIYFPALDLIAKDLHVRTQDVNLTITSYLIIQGISPLIWGSLSDKLGRRPVYIYSFLVYIVSNAVLSASPSFSVLLLFRGLQAAGSASTVSIGNGVIQDITTSSERGGFLSFYQAIRNLSIAGGPVLGGVLAKFLGFRSIFVFLLILSTVTILGIALFLPETLRSIAGDGSLHLRGIHQPLIDRLRKGSDKDTENKSSYARPPISLKTFLEPLLLLKERNILFNLIFGGVIYAIWSMITSSTTTLFKQIFFLDELQLGLVFIPNGLGTIVGSTVIGILMSRSFKKAEADYLAQHDKMGNLASIKTSLPVDFPIEKARLRHIPWVTAMFILSTVAYGFSLSTTSNAVFAVNQTLVSDLCPGKGASSTAINNLFRCSLGALGVALIDTMIITMGVGPSFAALGFVTVIICPL
ncbi:hypothetical protein E8E13_000278 [Curvularia kusanoi]|uniref:Major facilitator superfamily (MFS) profile domain-containing protein n=1 Tax=Curvularia kusanoi TaxID=90978 RepID=A0A9P4W3Q3_CURKU|nr:hypothetical protein E8E13_000278 [Curvularia kusanoi]